MSKHKNILITGGTGLIGQLIQEEAKNRGHSVRILTSNKKKANQIDAFYWDIEKKTIDPLAFKGVDTVIHLAGEPLAKGRWTPQQKQKIFDSRYLGTKLLVDHIIKNNYPITTFVGSSAVGYYPANSGLMHTEEESPGNGFLATVCQYWERPYRTLLDFGVSTSWVRTGIVLSKEGGALAPLKTSAQFGLASGLGNGQQVYSWIHQSDIVGIFIFLAENSLQGPFNGSSPNPKTQREISKTISSVLKRPFIMPNVPAFALKLILGEKAEMILSGHSVSSKKIEEAGYSFYFPKLEEALNHLLKQKRS